MICGYDIVDLLGEEVILPPNKLIIDILFNLN